MSRDFIVKLIKGSASTSIGTFASVLFHFFSIMVMTRYAEKEVFGIYVLILVIVHCLKIIGSLGLDLTMVKLISEDAGNQQAKKPLFEILASRVILLAGLSLIVYATGHLVLPFFDGRIADYLLYIPIMFCLASLRELFFFLLQGLQYFRKYAVVQTASAVFKFILVLLFANFSELNLANLIYIELMMLLGSFLHQLLVIPLRAHIDFRFDRSAFNNIIRFSLPLYANNILTFVYGRINIFLIGIFLNPVSIALYDIAAKIPEGVDRMFKSFIVVYFPNFSKLLAEGNQREAQRMMNQSLILFSVIIVFGVLASFLFREEIFRLIFSDQYLDASFAFSLMMLNFYIQAIYNIMGYSLVSAGHPAVPAKINLVSSTVNITGALLMIPAFGFLGAVYAHLAMDIVSQILHFQYLKKAGIQADYRRYLQPVMILAVLVALYMLIGIETYFMRSIFLAGYVALSWLLMKEFRNLIHFSIKLLRKAAFQTT